MKKVILSTDGHVSGGTGAKNGQRIHFQHAVQPRVPFEKASKRTQRNRAKRSLKYSALTGKTTSEKMLAYKLKRYKKSKRAAIYTSICIRDRTNISTSDSLELRIKSGMNYRAW